jgi:hypothetical protein
MQLINNILKWNCELLWPSNYVNAFTYTMIDKLKKVSTKPRRLATSEKARPLRMAQDYPVVIVPNGQDSPFPQ